jgi:uncharacterized protein (TIGR03437 family)
VKKIALVLLLSGQFLPADSGSIRVVNSASFINDTSLAPGTMISIFGENLAGTTALATDPANPPLTLGGVTVTIRGNQQPLYFVTPSQINARIDPATPTGPATLSVNSPTRTFMEDIVLATSSTPGVFSLFGTGTRDGAIENAVTYALGPFTVTTNGKPTFLSIFATGLDVSTAPTVTIGGLSVPVAFYGPAPCCVGLEQVNVQLTPALAGAGRVEVAVASGGKASNVTEVVILPDPGQGPYPPPAENQARSREIASIAWVPDTSLALVADENDDVVRVVDLKRRVVTGVITLPEGAQPVAVAVNDGGTEAVVAERNRGKAAILDIAALKVSAEIPVGGGPSSVAFAGPLALVANQDTDTVSVIDILTQQVTNSSVGRGPRGVAADVTSGKAYVTNQDDGTVTVIDLTTNANPPVAVDLPPYARPASIQLVPSLGLAAITDPSASSNGQAYLLTLPEGSAGTVLVNPGRDGGVEGVAAYANTVYYASPTGGSVSATPLAVGGGFSATSMKVDLGSRALAVDTVDRLLLVANEGSGTVSLVDLDSNQIAGSVNAILGPNETGGQNLDNHNDRLSARNAPALASISPSAAPAGSSITITVNGTNLAQADALFFVDPSTLPVGGNTQGEVGDEHSHAPFGIADPNFTVTNIVANPAGNQLTATVAISGKSPIGLSRVVRVETPNGDTSFVASAANTFQIN